MFDEELELRYVRPVRVAGFLASIDDSKEGTEEENEGICVVDIVVGITVVNEEVGIRSNSSRLRGSLQGPVRRLNGINHLPKMASLRLK